MSLCRACSAPILWVYTVAGYRMPLDAKSHQSGNIAISPAGVAEVLSGQSMRDYEGPLYRAHFVTCPFAGEFRTQRPPKRGGTGP